MKPFSENQKMIPNIAININIPQDADSGGVQSRVIGSKIPFPGQL